MLRNIFKPHHINTTHEELDGNNGIGRYIFLPGAEGRAREISEHFENVTVKHHQREHNMYLGTLNYNGKKIDVAAVSTGMGCPSTEIIVHELYSLGAKRFLRVGTSGTLQPGWISVGHYINVQASVRDEDTTRNYAPIELPAVASLEMISSVILAAKSLGFSDHLHTGTVHCKSSLYAREMGSGPRAQENQAYLNLLAQSGVLATEMETATLFIQSQLYNYQLMQEGEGPQHRVLAGAILGIIGTTDYLDDSIDTRATVDNSVKIALETIKILADQEI